MTADSEKSWWEQRDDLTPETSALLREVDAVFARRSPPTPGWPDPRLLDGEPGEDAFEGSSQPEKFRIVVARAEAWATVLLGRGWARASSSARWALPPMETGGLDTVLTPSADGAVPLVLTLHEPVSAEHIVTISIGAGDPAVRLTDVPDCGCDGCDDGSESLLAELDGWVLAVVGGSLDVELTAEQYSARTSDRVTGSSPVQGFVAATAFSAASWAEGWTPRPVAEPVESQAPQSGLSVQLAYHKDVVQSAFRKLTGRPEPGPQVYRAGKG